MSHERASQVPSTDLRAPLRLERRIVGDGSAGTVLFLHGLGTDLRHFLPQQHAFRRMARTIAFSLRGHGYSGVPSNQRPEGFTLPVLAGDVLAALDELGEGPVHVVGHGLGGLVGCQMLRSEPDRIASLTLVSTTAESHVSPPRRWGQGLLLRLGGVKVWSALWLRSAAMDERVEGLIEEMIALASPEAIECIARNLCSYDYREELARPLPVLLMRSGLDTHVSGRLGPTLQALGSNPGFQLVDIPETGHFPNMERPVVFSHTLARFLAKQGLPAHRMALSAPLPAPRRAPEGGAQPVEASRVWSLA